MERPLVIVQFFWKKTDDSRSTIVNIQKQLSNMIVKSDSRIVIQAITGDIKAQSQTFNTIEYIRVLESS